MTATNSLERILAQWPQSAAAILDFWFLPADAPEYGVSRAEWFRKSDAFDAEIVQRFGSLLNLALDTGHQLREALCARLQEPNNMGPQMLLAYIILLDQFTRNAFRNTPTSFAGDPFALAASLAMLEAGADRQLIDVQRWFAYLPLEHAENLAMQQRSVALYAELAAEDQVFSAAHTYAIAHHDVIAQFGRFPHRNQILARPNTAAEEQFLLQPGSRF